MRVSRLWETQKFHALKLDQEDLFLRGLNSRQFFIVARPFLNSSLSTGESEKRKENRQHPSNWMKPRTNHCPELAIAPWPYESLCCNSLSCCRKNRERNRERESRQRTCTCGWVAREKRNTSQCVFSPTSPPWFVFLLAKIRGAFRRVRSRAH